MDKNIEIGRRIRQRREELGLTQEELGNHVGLNKSTIQRYENGLVSKIKLPVLESMAVKLGVNPDWLALKTDKMKIESEPKQELERLSSVYMRPIYDSVSAGFGALADDHIVGYQPVFIANPHDVDDTICIRVTGCSMYPKIEDGDMIVVRKQSTVDTGRIAVVRIGDEAVVKRVTVGKDSLTLESINPI